MPYTLKMVALASVAIVSVMSAGPAAAEPNASASVADSQRTAPHGTWFIAGYTRDDAGSWVVEFFAGYSSDSPAGATLTARRALLTPAGREQTRTITDVDCGALPTVVASLSRLTAPRIEPHLSPRAGENSFPPMVGPRTETATYTIWGRGEQASGGGADIVVTSSTGLIAQWGDYAEAALRSCWSG